MGRLNPNPNPFTYTLYRHVNKENNKIYIGITKTSPQKRWNKGNGYKRSVYFYSAIKKYGWDGFEHEVLLRGLTKEQAELKEIEFIKYYKSNFRDFGYNLNNGGNCVGTLSESTRHKMSLAKKGKYTGINNPNYGKHPILKGSPCSEETKNKISEAKKGKPIFSEYQKAKRSKDYSGEKNPNAKKVAQYDLNGNLINIFTTIREASKITSANETCISLCCNKKQKTCKNFVWRFVLSNGGVHNDTV